MSVNSRIVILYMGASVVSLLVV